MNKKLEFANMSERDFLESIAKYWKRLFHLALSLRGNYADAEDAVQDVIIHATKKRAQFLGKSSIYTWLVRILINYCRDKYKKDKRTLTGATGATGAAGLFYFQKEGSGLTEIDIPDERENPQRKVELSDESNRLINVVQKLNPELRELIILRYYENYTYLEIAQMLNLPEGTVKSRLNNARRIMKKYLEKVGVKGV